MAKKNPTDKPGFMWYPSYTEAIKNPNLTDSNRVILLFAMTDYMEAMGDIEPDLEYPLDMCFALVRPHLDSSLSNWKNGKLGGRPKKAETPLSVTETPLSKNGNPPEKQGKEKEGNVSKGNPLGILDFDPATYVSQLGI